MVESYALELLKSSQPTEERTSSMAEIQKIDSIPLLDELIERSSHTPVWILKHSLTCPISAQAWSEFKRFAAESPEDGPVLAVVEIQNARPVSLALAERTGVRHESPQALLLRDGRVAWHANHYSIDCSSMQRA
jgi:bacillithiol system protein YtxJ